MPRTLPAAAAAFCVSVLALAASAQAAEVKVLAVGALTGAFKELIPQFERASGHKLIVQYQATPVLLKQIEAGEPFDLAILIASALKDPTKQALFTGPADTRVQRGSRSRGALAHRSLTCGRPTPSSKRCSTPSRSRSCRKASTASTSPACSIASASANR